MISVDPQKYKLSKRINLKKGPSGLFVVIDRKSRVIMKDAHRILKIANQIKTIEPDIKIGVFSTAPVCSKTRVFLSDNNLHITLK